MTPERPVRIASDDLSDYDITPMRTNSRGGNKNTITKFSIASDTDFIDESTIMHELDVFETAVVRSRKITDDTNDHNDLPPLWNNHSAGKQLADISEIDIASAFSDHFGDNENKSWKITQI